MKGPLQTLAHNAADAMDSPDLPSALRILTAGLIEAFNVDWSGILCAEEDPPLLVVTERKDIGDEYHQEMKAHMARVYARVSQIPLSGDPAVVVHRISAAPEAESVSDSGAADRAVINEVLVSSVLAGRELLGLVAVAMENTFPRGLEQELQTAARWLAVVLKGHRRIRYSASTDNLTGVFTRRRIEEELEYLIASTARLGQSLSLAIIDLDSFKTVNELYDLVTGDEVLREVARLLRELRRASDIVGRIGSDEFAVIMPQTGGEEAFRLAHRWRAELSGQSFCDGRLRSGLHVSVGLADSHGQPLAPHELISKADKALYEAKKTGGNRVVLAP